MGQSLFPHPAMTTNNKHVEKGLFQNIIMLTLI